MVLPLGLTPHEGNSKISNGNPNRVVPSFIGLDKRNTMAFTKRRYNAPRRNGDASKLKHAVFAIFFISG
jgi:hypothetical protein